MMGGGEVCHDHRVISKKTKQKKKAKVVFSSKGKIMLV